MSLLFYLLVDLYLFVLSSLFPLSLISFPPLLSIYPDLPGGQAQHLTAWPEPSAVSGRGSSQRGSRGGPQASVAGPWSGEDLSGTAQVSLPWSTDPARASWRGLALHRPPCCGVMAVSWAWHSDPARASGVARPCAGLPVVERWQIPWLGAAVVRGDPARVSLTRRRPPWQGAAVAVGLRVRRGG